MKRLGRQFSISTLALVAMLMSNAVRADIFKCSDSDGHVTYSNVAARNCKTLTLDPIPAASKSAAKNPTPASFPKVDEATQKARDTDRRRILENELAAEKKAMDEAAKQLAEQESQRLGDERNYQKVLDRLQPYKDKVALHGRNVEAIKKEIANLR